MIHINVISSLGLGCNIVGAVMLFFYGLPSKLKEHGGSILLEERKKAEKKCKKENKKITRSSYIALTLILIGFILQIIGVNFLP
jgi:hypothetical protein